MKALKLQEQILPYKVLPSFILVTKLLIITGPVQNRRVQTLQNRARQLIKNRDYERAIRKLQECLRLKPESKMKASILGDLGFCSLKLGWFQDAAIAFGEYLKIQSSDNEGSFFLASAYVCLIEVDR